MKTKNDFVLRNIADENIAIPIGEGSDRLNGVITLSESGAFLWEKLQAEQTEETLLTALTDEYDVDTETAQKDIRAFLGKLRELGCLEE